MVAQGEEKKYKEVEAVVMMTDMVGYSRRTRGMSPSEICTFLLAYHEKIQKIVQLSKTSPCSVEPLAGDGSVIIFTKRCGESTSDLCDRAVELAVQLALEMETNQLLPTRVGLVLGEIVITDFGNKVMTFGTSFSLASRVEELCGYFNCHFLMDRRVARSQTVYKDFLVSIGKISLPSIVHPVNLYTLYIPGLYSWKEEFIVYLFKFIKQKNEAMEYFCGNQKRGVRPFLPYVREKLLESQKFAFSLTGKKDTAISCILKYITEHPHPDSDFELLGMQMQEKARDSFGKSFCHLSCDFLRSLDLDLYEALINESEWENAFKLEWRKKGDVIVRFGDDADGVYYLERGVVEVYDQKGTKISEIEPGNVFGEIAYLYGVPKRTADVVAKENVVLRKISSEDLALFPAIQKVFKKIALRRLQSCWVET